MKVKVIFIGEIDPSEVKGLDEDDTSALIEQRVREALYESDEIELKKMRVIIL